MILSLALAALPALYAGWDGHRLLAHRSEAVFGELLQAHRHRVTRVALATVVFLAVLARNHALWSIPLSLVGVLVGSFPARRRIFDERWSLRAYLDHHLRLILGLAGGWLLVLVAPAVCAANPRILGLVAPALVAVSLIASLFGSRLLLGLVRAAPLEMPELHHRFQRVLARARCRRPRIYRAGPKGGRWVNAFALPTPLAPAVLMTNDLIESLDPEESTAIFAHEVAHLEEATTSRWLARVLVPPLLATAISIAFWRVDPSSPARAWLLWGAPVLVLLSIVAAQGRSRSHETASDLRAVELCGNADALVRGLTRIHDLAQLPRRLAANVEERATHPSLARRIQAIREAHGPARGASPRTEGPRALVLRSAGEDGTAVVLLDDRLQWLEGIEDEIASAPDEAWRRAARARALAYGEVSELRVEASQPGRQQLVAIDAGGERWTLPLRAGDAAAAQAFLDDVDIRLAAPRRSTGLASAFVARWTALLAVVTGLLPPWSGGLCLAGLVACVWPSRLTLLVTAVTGLIDLLLLVLVAGGTPSPLPLGTNVPAVGIPLLRGLVLGILLLAVLVRGRRKVFDDSRAARRGAIALLLVALAGIALRLAAAPTSLATMNLHLWVRSAPAPLVLAAGLPIALLALRAPGMRWGIGLLGAVLVCGLAATTSFRESLTDDLFRTTPARFPLETAPLSWIRAAHVDAAVDGIEISPSGTRIAVRSPRGFSAGASCYRVEAPSGTLVLEGDDLEWADDETVLVMSSTADDVELRQVDLARGHVVTTSIDDTLVQPRLSLRDGRWWITGRRLRGMELVEYAGTVGRTAFSRRTWSLPVPTSRLVSTASDGNGTALAAVVCFPEGDSWLRALTPGAFSPVTQIWWLDGDEARKLGDTVFATTLLAPGEAARDYTCVAASSHTSEVWSLDPRSGSPTPGGSLGGWTWARDDGDNLVLSQPGGPVLLVENDPGAKAGSRLWAMSIPAQDDPDPAGARWEAVAYRADVLAIARGASEGLPGTDIRLYRVAPPRGRRDPAAL